MSIPDSPSNESSPAEPKRQAIAAPIRTTVVSMRWLIVGFIGLSGLAGIAAAMYSVQSASMSSKVLDVVQRMVEESDRDKAKIDEVSTEKGKTELILNSLKLRGDAANLLNNFRQSNQAEAGSAVLEKLYEILDSLYTDYGGRSTPGGRERGAQLSEVAVELINTVSDAESLKYRIRLLELAWDAANYPDIISRGLSLLTAAQAAGDAGDARFQAMRYITMAMFDSLQTEPYQRSLHKLPPDSFPETMDELLDKLIVMKPEDIDIARRSATFIIRVQEANFRACASDTLLGKSLEERRELAKTRIDDMVQRNQQDPTAYIYRYHFLKEFNYPKGALDQDDPDLAMTRKLAPNHRDGLLLSGQDALRQMEISDRNNERERSLEWQNKAEEYFRSAVKYNLADPVAYQFLGDFLLFVKKQPKEAIDVWDQGLLLSEHRGDDELVGRLVWVLLDQKSESALEKVREKLDHLTHTITEMQFYAPTLVRRTSDMLELLTAQLYKAEADIAASKIEAAGRENRTAEVRRLSGIVQQKRGDALQKFDRLLRNFGKAREDFNVFAVKSVYNYLVPDCMFQAGVLHANWQQWDAAISYFERACLFETGSVRLRSLAALARIFQIRRQYDQAALVLQKASELAPNNINFRLDYVESLFRAESASSSPSVAALDTAQRELELLEARRAELQQPWVLDILRIHLGLVRADATSLADDILEAMNEAERQFRILEQGTFPPDADGNSKKYIDDIGFVAYLAGIYSNLAALSDFDRMLLKLRAFPNGEAAYFKVRTDDFLRRDDKAGAFATMDEALTSSRLSAAQKEQIADQLQSFKESSAAKVSPLDQEYALLKTSFDESPESLTPPRFFRLAQLSFEQGETEQVKAIMERLKKIEGPEGRYWQFIEVRLMLGEPDPDYVVMRQKQEALVRTAPEWDEAFVLRAEIEEQFLAKNPGDPVTINQLISSFKSATEYGNANPLVWRRLIELLDSEGRTEESNSIQRTAVLRGVSIQEQMGQLPAPYGRMYSQVQEAIEADDAIGADGIARQCITLAERRGAKPELIFSLNWVLGKLFMDAAMYDSAVRHLSSNARHGGRFVYPLAVCVAKSGDIDGGFTLLLDEIDLQPSSMSALLAPLIILLNQVSPSEAVYERIDRLMEQIEQGKTSSLKGVILASPQGNLIPLGNSWTPYRKVKSLVVRFPDKKEALDPSAIQFIDPVALKPEVQPALPPTPVPSVAPEQANPVPPQAEQVQTEQTQAASSPSDVSVTTAEPTPPAQAEPPQQPVQQ